MQNSIVRAFNGSVMALAGLTAAVLLGASAAQAAFPDKPIKIVVPYSPGGGADLIARGVGRGCFMAALQGVVRQLHQPLQALRGAG